MKQFLIVVDMQKDFVDGSLGSPEAVAIAPNVAEKIRSFIGDIFVTYDTHNEDYLNTSEGRHLPVKHCIREKDGWQLHDTVADALSDHAYTKVEKPTFGSVRLPELIASAANGDDFTIELIGVCTDICVVSNALLLKAHFPEKEISVDSRCCAGVSPVTHQAALDVMRCCQITIK